MRRAIVFMTFVVQQTNHSTRITSFLPEMSCLLCNSDVIHDTSSQCLTTIENSYHVWDVMTRDLFTKHISGFPLPIPLQRRFVISQTSYFHVLLHQYQVTHFKYRKLQTIRPSDTCCSPCARNAPSPSQFQKWCCPGSSSGRFLRGLRCKSNK